MLWFYLIVSCRVGTYTWLCFSLSVSYLANVFVSISVNMQNVGSYSIGAYLPNMLIQLVAVSNAHCELGGMFVLGKNDTQVVSSHFRHKAG